MFEDVSGDEGVTPEVKVAATRGMEIDTYPHVEQDNEDKDGIDYGSNVERTMAYIKSLEDVLERDRVLG